MNHHWIIFCTVFFCRVSWLVWALLSSALQFYLHCVLIVPLGSSVSTRTLTPSQYNMCFLELWIVHKCWCQWWRPCCFFSGWRGLSRDEHRGHQEGSGGFSTWIFHLCVHRCTSQRLSAEERRSPVSAATTVSGTCFSLIALPLK